MFILYFIYILQDWTFLFTANPNPNPKQAIYSHNEIEIRVTRAKNILKKFMDYFDVTMNSLSIR